MNFTTEINQNLFCETIKFLNKLIELQSKHKNLLNMNKEQSKAKPITFKISNYKKWIRKLEDLNNSNITPTIDNLKTNKISDKCISKMIEINDTNDLKEINELDKKNQELEEKLKKEFIKDKTTKNNSRATRENMKDISFEISALQRVHGIGPSNSEAFLSKGITLQKLLDEWESIKKSGNQNLVPEDYYDNISIQKLKNFNNEIRDSYIKRKFGSTKYLKLLKYDQLIGIKYFYDIEERIPRKEISKIQDILKLCLKQMNDKMIVNVCGSFRRGNSNSGDIDVLITHPDIQEKEDFDNLNQSILNQLIIYLSKAGFLKDHLTIAGDTKYMGLCKLKNTKYNRRIDIRFIPYNSYAAAKLYFTGSGNFNKIMREHANKKGYTLNEYGLYKLEFNKSQNKMVKDYKVDCKTEKQIFKKLDFEWKKPTERNI